MLFSSSVEEISHNRVAVMDTDRGDLEFQVEQNMIVSGDVVSSDVVVKVSLTYWGKGWLCRQTDHS